MLCFQNDGGPLMLSPRDPEPLWEGIAPPSAGRVVDAAFRWLSPDDPATDYDRACDVNAGAALLDAGAGWVIVLRASEEGGLWLPTPPPGVAAVAIGIGEWAEDITPESVQALYARFADMPWKVLGEDVPLGEGGAAMLHAGGARGEEKEYAHDAEYERYPGEGGAVYIGDAIVYPVPPGRYRVEAYEHLVWQGDHLALVRFMPRAA